MPNNVQSRIFYSVYFKLLLLFIFIFMFWIALKSYKAPKYLIVLVLLTAIIFTFDKLLRKHRKWPGIVRLGGGNITRLRAMIDNTADVNIAEEAYGRTALHQAVSSGRAENVRLLVSAGANINIKDKEGRTPLMEAVYWCDEEVVKALIDLGADINARSNAGLTALDFAEQGACKKITDLLTNAGAINGGHGSPI